MIYIKLHNFERGTKRGKVERHKYRKIKPREDGIGTSTTCDKGQHQMLSLKCESKSFFYLNKIEIKNLSY